MSLLATFQPPESLEKQHLILFLFWHFLVDLYQSIFFLEDVEGFDISVVAQTKPLCV